MQNATLGRGIAEHWRGGKASLGDLIALDGQVMTLTQLRRMLFTSDPAGYVAWLQDLPTAARDAILGPKLARALKNGAASLDELLLSGVQAGIVEL